MSLKLFDMRGSDRLGHLRALGPFAVVRAQVLIGVGLGAVFGFCAQSLGETSAPTDASLVRSASLLA